MNRALLDLQQPPFYSAHEMIFNSAALSHYGLTEADAQGDAQINYAQ